MFPKFELQFRLDAALSRREAVHSVGRLVEPLLKELLLQFGGASFNNGLYRIVSNDVLELSRTFLDHAFPDFASRVSAFGYDWLGRVFALDPATIQQGRPGVLMFEPGTGEALEIPANLITFHENELIDYSDASLAVEFHTQWLASGTPAPKHNQCIGYQRPLFLGGKDTIENLELSDLDVYWTLSGQLIQKTRSLPLGTRVKVQ